VHQVLPRRAQATAPAGGAAVSIHARLRRETKSLHSAVERKLELTAPGLSIDTYRRTLQAFYGFHSPLEARLRDGAAALRLPVAPLDRARLIERDLLALGMSTAGIGTLPRCADLPPFRSLEDVAGCLYVLEGAALGARIVTRVLADGLGIGVETGAAFFSGMAAGAANRWPLVLTWLDEVAAPAHAPDAMVTAARAIFAALERWLPDREAGQ
jgi:heme oxygenase